MRYGAKRESISDRLVSALKGYVPGAFLNPRKNELVALYRLRYRMAMDEKKYDAARVFLDKILELDPEDLDARICHAELFHRHLRDYNRAVEQYTRVIKLAGRSESDAGTRARGGLTELIELLS